MKVTQKSDVIWLKDLNTSLNSLFQNVPHSLLEESTFLAVLLQKNTFLRSIVTTTSLVHSFCRFQRKSENGFVIEPPKRDFWRNVLSNLGSEVWLFRIQVKSIFGCRKCMLPVCPGGTSREKM